jgi:hypothetical protein
VEVKSPDYVQGKQSGTRREVDVSVRGTVGTVSILAILECRKRKHRQDVTWIEQLASTKEDVGASHAVAVSAQPFTAGAVSMAAARGIELRTFAEIDEEAVLGWVSDLFSSMRDLAVEWDTIELKLCDPQGEVVDSAQLAKRQQEFTLTDPIFRLPDGSMHSMMAVFFSDAINAIVSNLPPDTLEWAPSFKRDFEPGALKYIVDVEGKSFELVAVSVHFRVRVSKPVLKMGPRYAYRSSNGLLTRSAQIQGDHNGISITYGAHDDNARMAISVQCNDRDPDRMFRISIGGLVSDVPLSTDRADGNSAAG